MRALRMPGGFETRQIRVYPRSVDRAGTEKVLSLALVGPDGAYDARVLIERPDGSTAEVLEIVRFEGGVALLEIPYHLPGLSGEYRVALFVNGDLTTELTVSD